MPVEPDEMPVQPERPEINSSTDPGEPQIPQEVPPDKNPKPEINPDEFEK